MIKYGDGHDFQIIRSSYRNRPLHAFRDVVNKISGSSVFLDYALFNTRTDLQGTGQFPEEASSTAPGILTYSRRKGVPILVIIHLLHNSIVRLKGVFRELFLKVPRTETFHHNHRRDRPRRGGYEEDGRRLA